MRAADLLRAMASTADEIGVPFRWEAGRLHLKTSKGLVVVDSRETAGPVTKRLLSSWIRGLGGEFKALVTVGFYLKEAVAMALAEPGLRGRLTLLEMGLRDYMDLELKPRIFIAGPKEMAMILERAAERLELRFQKYPCDLCGQPIRGACRECGSILCLNHLIICPICRSTFCHPDTGRRCFHIHRCR